MKRLTSNSNRFNITVNEEGNETKHQVTTFADQAQQWDYTVDSHPDPTFGIADTNDANLENFFSRPIKTQSFTWAIGSTFYEKFNPWIDFFENPRVINRITNYNLLRCKLKCRIVLNGNGFYYGRAVASYIPLHNLDSLTKDRAFFIQDVVAASQRPHVYLDPTNSQGGTLTLPFVWYENALRIPNMEWREMGDIIVHGMQPLKHANGSVDPITVSVFVWAEEVSLSVPTANEPGALSPQMGLKGGKDEYGTGPISKPAGTIAKIAGALESVPPIAPFAKATHMAASAVSNIASMFGYSRPTSLAEIQPYKPTFVGNMANTNVPDTSTKLTLDAKQELTIDPRVMGLGSADEMTIKSIACRESWLTSFPWGTTDGAETLLWTTEVSPVLWNELGSPKEIHMPACCYAALPFKHWRGTMKFRIQVVASAFHKGRLKITYDPSYPLTNEYNTNYTHIIDLAKERDFTIEIGWGHERSMVGHRNPGTDSLPWRTTPLGADPLNAANGIMSIYVVNDLTTPNSTADNDVSVNVFVSTADNFEVFNPDSDILQNLVWFTPQVGEKLVYESQSGEKAQVMSTLATALAAVGGALISLLIALLMRLQTRLDTATRDIIELRESRLQQEEDILNVKQMVYDTQMAEKGGESHPDADMTKAENEPMKMESTEHIASRISPSDHTIDVFYGDPVTSFRQCLKRYEKYRVWSVFQTQNNLNDGGLSLVGRWESLPDFPIYRGYAADAVDNCSVPAYPTPYNYVEMTLLNYITPGFTCRRGGLRHKYFRFGGSTDDIWYVTRHEFGSGVTTQFNFAQALGTVGTPDTQTRQLFFELPHTWDGAHATHPTNNPVLEVELPFYNNVRFLPAKYVGYMPTDLESGEYHDVAGTWTLPGNARAAGLIDFVSVGEDFQLGFFTGAPIAYYVTKGTDPPTL